jgi:hypothetical protein
MLVTDAMLQAAVKKAVEFGLLPGYWKCTEKEREDWAWVFRKVLEAALAEADAGRGATVPPPADPFPDCRFVVVHEVPSGFDALTGKLVCREVAMLGTDDRAVAEGYAGDLARPERKAWVVDRVTE